MGRGGAPLRHAHTSGWQDMAVIQGHMKKRLEEDAPKAEARAHNGDQESCRYQMPAQPPCQLPLSSIVPRHSSRVF